MKKLLGLLIVPIIAIMCLCGCSGDKTSADVKKLYENMTATYISDELENKFFSDATRPNTLVISYPSEVKSKIDNTNPVTDLQKKYVAIGYQQKILDIIYNYYERNFDNFYKVMSSTKFNKNEMKDLYSSLDSLKLQLSDFKSSYQVFCDATESNVSDVMKFHLTNYSHELNRVIDKSFSFIYKFINLNQKYCISDFDDVTSKSLELKIQKSYVDIANIVFLTNFKALDFSSGSNGICYSGGLIGNNNQFVILKDLSSIKTLSSEIAMGLEPDNINYNTATALVNDYLYARDVYEQRYKNFKAIYNDEDIYTINQYKFGFVPGVDYESYLGTLTKSKQSTIRFMDSFVTEVYSKLVKTMNLILA